jgi:hypothetical protein
MLRAERKLMKTFEKVEGQLRGIRAAINALNGNNVKVHTTRRGNKLRGRKLSAAHRRAIKEGIARAKKAAA